ncbi:MAG: YncE family protein [Gaiellaceae bacterium]
MDRRELLAAAAAGSLSLALDPRAVAAALGGGVSPTALVTADEESHVVVFDLASAEVVSRLRTAPGPRSIESVHGLTAIVAHTASGVVSVLAVGPLGLREELDAFDAPRYTAVHPTRPLAFMTDSAREEIVVLDPEKAKVIWRTRVPGPARHVTVSRDGRTLWTALGTAAARVAVLDLTDPRRPRLVRTFAPPFLAHDVVFAPDGRTVWVTSGSERRIALYRGERRPARVLAAGSPPQHVAFARDKAFVANGDDGTVHRHRLDGERVREARVPVGSYNLAFDWGSLVTPSLGVGTVSVLTWNGRVRAVRKVARAAHDVCIVHAR